MGKLKIKDIEGELSDIHQFFSSENCDLSSYLGAEKKQNKIPILWIGTIVVVFFVLCCCIWNNVFNYSWNKVATLGVFILSFLIVGLFYYNFKNAGLLLFHLLPV